MRPTMVSQHLSRPAFKHEESAVKVWRDAIPPLTLPWHDARDPTGLAPRDGN